MKNTNTCPKCNGNNILDIYQDKKANETTNFIQIGGTFFSSVLVKRYLCCDCGYVEEWIDKEDIEKIVKKLGKN